MVDFLIVGADAAGLSAAVQIKRKAPQASIKVINKGNIISYGACGIPYVLSGEIPSSRELVHFTPESFREQRGIPVEVSQEAVDISPEDHSVTIKDTVTHETKTLDYGKLLIATGAVPIKLPFLDHNLEGVFSLHTIEDLESILDYIARTKPKKAAVIGAGNIGCELMEALVQLGIEVRVFEILETPVANWPRIVQEVVQIKMKEKGIHFSGGTAVHGVSQENGSLRVFTADGDFTADILFSVVGTRPTTGFCKDKLKTLKNGALVIDRSGLTSDADIYAAGDCATVFHSLLDRNVYFPLGSTANKMGRIAGINMAGEFLSFPGIVGTQIFKFFELSLAQTGLGLDQAGEEGIAAEAFSAKRSDRAGYYPGAGSATVEIIVESNSGKILGATAVSTANAAQFIDAAAVAVYSGLGAQDLAWFDMAYAPPFAPVWNALISSALKAAKI